MAVALKADKSKSQAYGGAGRPVDLVHLSKQTMGDRDLEREVLFLFASQASTYLVQAGDAASREEVIRVAHTIKGAARSIGAGDLADIAQKCEQAGKFDMRALESAFAEVVRYIEEICAGCACGADH